jgi:NADH-quinone oxidoreductase subunit G
MKEVIGTKSVGVLQHDVGQDDDFLLKGDRTPNRAGVKAIGMVSERDDVAEILRGIRDGVIKALYVMEDDIAAIPEFKSVMGNLELLVVHASVMNETARKADIVLPASTYAEKHGTFVNCEGRVQRIRPAVAALEQDRALDGFAMSRWDRFAAHNDRWGKGVKRDCRPSWRILHAVAAAYGTKWKYGSAEDVFRDLAEKIPVFKGLTYASVGMAGAMLTMKDKVSVKA